MCRQNSGQFLFFLAGGRQNTDPQSVDYLLDNYTGSFFMFLPGSLYGSVHWGSPWTGG